jgi:hypothetical protein
MLSTLKIGEENMKKQKQLAIAGLAIMAVLLVVPMAYAATPPDNTLTGLVNSINTIVLDIQTKVNFIKTIVQGIETDVHTLLVNMSALDAKVTSIQGTLTTISTNIGTLLGQLTGVETTVNDINATVHDDASFVDDSELASALSNVHDDISSVNMTVNDINATVNELGNKINGDTLRTTGIQTLYFPEPDLFYKLWVNSTANAPFEVKAIYVQACNPSTNPTDDLTVQWGPIIFTRAPYTLGALSELILVNSPYPEDVVPAGLCYYMHELLSAYGATINPTVATGQMWIYVDTLTYNQTAGQSINVEVIVESSADVALSLTASGD